MNLSDAIDRLRYSDARTRVIVAAAATVAAAGITVAVLAVTGTGAAPGEIPVTVEEQILGDVAAATSIEDTLGARRVLFTNTVDGGDGFSAEAIVDAGNDVEATVARVTGTGTHTSEIRSVDGILYTRFPTLEDAEGNASYILPRYVGDWLELDLGGRHIANSVAVGFAVDVDEYLPHLRDRTEIGTDTIHGIDVTGHELTFDDHTVTVNAETTPNTDAPPPGAVGAATTGQRRHIAEYTVWTETGTGRVVQLDLEVQDTFGDDPDTRTSYRVHFEQWDFDHSIDVDAPADPTSMDEAVGADPAR